MNAAATATRTTSPLDEAPARLADAAFLAETVTDLHSVGDRDSDTLAALCDDDFGTDELRPAGAP